MSTQWEASGYYYPVQVAQFGLSHYSKNLTEPRPKLRNLEDGSNSTAKWNVPIGASISRKYDPITNSWVAEFHTTGTKIFFCSQQNLTNFSQMIIV